MLPDMEKIATLLAVFLLVITSATCKAPTIDTNVKLTLEKEVDEEGVHVYGTTNLPDEAFLLIEASSMESWGGVAATNVRVRDGRYATYLNLNALCLHFSLSQIRFCPSLRATARYKVQR